jgi:O-succinylhomoserine sulfhydrylase
MLGFYQKETLSSFRQALKTLKVAEFLEQHPNVNRKISFLKSHPTYEVAQKQMKAGGVVAFEIIGGIA